MAHPTGSRRLTDFTTIDVTVQQLGAGGFGLVFMGPDRTQGGQWRALKTLRPELLALRPQLQDLFIQEGLTWVGLWPHLNLLTCSGATEIEGHVYLILAYASYGSLRELLGLEQPFRVRLDWAQHIAAGLVALHTPDPELLRPHPLVHRDLKPENVLIQQNGWAQITDFGLAAAVVTELRQAPEAAQAFALVEALAAQATQAGAQSSRATHAHQATRTARFQTRGAGGATHGTGLARGGVGTIAYMPPEQWLDGAEVGPPADLYAFGLLLSELLAGRHGLGDLEEERSEEGWYQLHLNGMPRPLRSGPAAGASRLPAQLETLYGALLAKRTEERPTAAEALAGLQQAAKALGEEPYTPPEVYPRTDANRKAVWLNWANTCLNFGRLEAALERNSRALALTPEAFDVRQTRGIILAQLGLRAREAGKEDDARRQLEEALAWHTRALAVADTDQERKSAHKGRAYDLGGLGRYAEADVAYAALLALDLDDAMGWFSRAINVLLWGQAETAVGHMEAAERNLAAGEMYAMEAIRCSPNDQRIIELLARFQQLRSQLGT